MKTHKMQRSQWHHCPHNNCDSKFKSKTNLRHHTEGHDALDSDKTYPYDHCDYIGKMAKRLANHKQVHKEHRCDYAGCNTVLNYLQKLLNHKKEDHFKVYCNK